MYMLFGKDAKTILGRHFERLVNDFTYAIWKGHENHLTYAISKGHENDLTYAIWKGREMDMFMLLLSLRDRAVPMYHSSRAS